MEVEDPTDRPMGGEGRGAPTRETTTVARSIHWWGWEEVDQARHNSMVATHPSHAWERAKDNAIASMQIQKHTKNGSVRDG